jgi:single-stranded-DNA-specific exonuclease
VVEPRFRWEFPAALIVDQPLLDAGRRRGLSNRLIELLARRGVHDETELDAFFAEPAAGLHDPWLLPDAAALVARIEAARSAGETIVVFGDFDADGLTGLAIMTIALRSLGLIVEPYVPSRLDDGHGLSIGALDRAVAIGARLIVTVDCGSSSVPEIAEARRRGIDVIVTDHHRIPPIPPAAVALVNPHRSDGTYPDRRLSGAGIAFKVAALLLDRGPALSDATRALSDLATIGSVADLAPIVGENRAIAKLGLVQIRTAPRPGILALLDAARIAPAAVDLETVGFTIAPRLNAAGRVGEAREAANLLLAENVAEATAIAERLEAANLTRRDMTKQSVAEAQAIIAAAGETGVGAVIVRGPWAVGIVGLVASRLADESGLPAIVGAEIGSLIRASCRSPGGLDLAAALETCAELFDRYGGHPGAAGFELPADRWETFRERFLVLATASAPADPRPSLRIDLALRAAAVDYPLLRELTALAPTGPGNPDPLVAVAGLTVSRVRAATGGHTQLTLRRELDVIDAIAFGRADLVDGLAEGDRIDVVARLASRAFGGYESLQLEIRDVAPSGTIAAAFAGHHRLPPAPPLAEVAS